MKDAEKFAEEDKKRKEEIEVKNNADSLVYQTEKTIKDLGNKISQSDKEMLESKIADLKKALEGQDTGMIKTASESLTNASYEVFGKAYQQEQAQQQGAAGGATGQEPPKDDNVVDADYEVVDDDDKK